MNRRIVHLITLAIIAVSITLGTGAAHAAEGIRRGGALVTVQFSEP